MTITTITKDSYLGLIPNNRWSCKYRRMETQYKRAYQRGYITFSAVVKRPDWKSVEVQSILQKLLDLAKWLMFYKNRTDKARLLKQREDEITALVEALP